ncbi:hypothetical protein CBL_13218 [Carabus blaptoides fortunei]
MALYYGAVLFLHLYFTFLLESICIFVYVKKHENGNWNNTRFIEKSVFKTRCSGKSGFIKVRKTNAKDQFDTKCKN